MSDQQKEALENMTAAMINKILHGPISRLKHNAAGEDEESVLYIAALKRLFDLEKE